MQKLQSVSGLLAPIVELKPIHPGFSLSYSRDEFHSCSREDLFSTVKQNPFRPAGVNVRTTGEPSCVQYVSEELRRQYQCRNANSSRNDTWKCHNSKDTSIMSNGTSCMSHHSLLRAETSSKGSVLANWGSDENQQNTGVHQRTVNDSGTTNRVLADMTNKDRQRIGDGSINLASERSKGKENQLIESKREHSRIPLHERKDSCRLGDIMEPLSVRRLRPIRQKTRNVVLSILDDETVSLEFIKPKGNDMYVTEVLRISSDGNKITSYCTNGQEGVLLKDIPPPIPGTAVSYAFSALPKRLWKKYQYADKFVRLVRMKSPKVSHLYFAFFELRFIVNFFLYRHWKRVVLYPVCIFGRIFETVLLTDTAHMCLFVSLMNTSALELINRKATLSGVLLSVA